MQTHIKTQRKIQAAVTIILALWLFVESIQTYLAITQFGQENNVIFNRAMFILAANYFILAISVVTYWFLPQLAIGASLVCCFFALSNLWLISGKVQFVGWFFIVPFFQVAYYLYASKYVKVTWQAT